MRKFWPAAVVLVLGISSAALADNTPPKPTGKMTPNGQNVVPITAFMEAPDFPFAPKPSLWKRFTKALFNPFARDPRAEMLPPGTVPTPGVPPTVGPRPAVKPPMR